MFVEVLFEAGESPHIVKESKEVEFQKRTVQNPAVETIFQASQIAISSGIHRNK